MKITVLLGQRLDRDTSFELSNGYVEGEIDPTWFQLELDRGPLDLEVSRSELLEIRRAIEHVLNNE